jgi:gliding motility-associated-like protein
MKSSSHKISFLLVLLVFFTIHGKATHNRAGEITYRHIEGYTFEFTVSTYTYYVNAESVDRDVIDVFWGDGTYQTVPRASIQSLPNFYRFNTYVAQHTFPGPGTYEILMQDPNRNLGVKNIPNSVNTIFSIKTLMLIGPFVGTNTTPVLLNPPIDRAAKDHIFIHNPAAFDADGDSISYELTVCTEENGVPIEGFTLPPASDTLFVNEISGDVTWKTPIETGKYNIALFIDEWREGVRIGRITRDMQIDVYETDNNPPVNGPISNYCVEAGDSIEFFITSTDADNDPIDHFLVDTLIFPGAIKFEIIEAGAGFTTSKFTMATNCSHVRQQPYTLVVKAEDQVNEVSLVDITSFSIRVLPNAPENLVADPSTNFVNLQWDVSTCGIPMGYRIYRRINPSNFVPDSCENGVPPYTGYTSIGEVMGANTTNFLDDNGGLGLVPGFDYCYMITAFYNDGAESFASEEVCTSLIPGVPSMLEVSVLSDDESTGEISVKWAVPQDFDTVDDGPYRYDIYRLRPGEDEYSFLLSIPTVDLTDTSYIDQGLNTFEYPYHYSVRLLYQDDGGNWIVHPGFETASSMYLNLVGKDNNINVEVIKHSPWLNYAFDIFRKPEAGSVFDSIARSPNSEYADTGLANNVPYTYRVKSLGLRPINEVDFFTTNISHLNTTSAVDSSAPCPPRPKVVSICDSSYNFLSWASPRAVCGDKDVVGYKIFYKPARNADFQFLDSVPSSDTNYIHNNNLETLAGFYGVTAVDSFYNESAMAITSVDSCLMFSLPNVFTPDGDGVNDIYVSYNLGGFVKNVDMTIFNRYGQTVYKTTDPDINWDGYHKDTGKLVATGVYYYVCELTEPRINGPVNRVLRGFIHVFSGQENKSRTE